MLLTPRTPLSELLAAWPDLRLLLEWNAFGSDPIDTSLTVARFCARNDLVLEDLMEDLVDAIGEEQSRAARRPGS